MRTGIMGFFMVVAASVSIAGTPTGVDRQQDLVLLTTNLVVTGTALPRLAISTQQIAQVCLDRVPLAAFRANDYAIEPVGRAASLQPLIVLAWDVVAPLGGRRPLAETAAGRLYDSAHKALLQAGPESPEYQEAMASYQAYHQQILARMAVFRNLDTVRTGAVRAPRTSAAP